MTSTAAPGVTAPSAFRYDGYELDPTRRSLTCHYSLGKQRFAEHISFGEGGDWESAGLERSAQLVFLLAGVSYYKTAAPAVVDLRETVVNPEELDLLRQFYVNGLGELAFRNGIDLSEVEFRATVRTVAPASVTPAVRNPLIPFGGGMDSIVTVDTVKEHFENATLFITSQSGIRFGAIEAAATLTGLPVRRADRSIDDKVLRSAELGFLLGHVPVTGIISAIAVMAAVLYGHDSVVMSNEWSASEGNLVVDGRTVNHQYSKSASFEAAFRAASSSVIGNSIAYFSLLRPFSELRVAERFAQLTEYHPVFHSCNRAFHIDPARRLDDWCGECDKCCFIDLILAPFLSPTQLRAVFGGREPLSRPHLRDRFRRLLGTVSGAKPFECVGAITECRAALQLTADRRDRAEDPLVRSLADELPERLTRAEIGRLLAPLGNHCIPDGFAAEDLLV